MPGLEIIIIAYAVISAALSLCLYVWQRQQQRLEDKDYEELVKKTPDTIAQQSASAEGKEASAPLEGDEYLLGLLSIPFPMRKYVEDAEAREKLVRLLMGIDKKLANNEGGRDADNAQGKVD